MIKAPQLLFKLKASSGLYTVTFLKSVQHYDDIRVQELKKDWAADSKKKRGSVSNAVLNVELLTKDEFAKEFRWDRNMAY